MWGYRESAHKRGHSDINIILYLIIYKKIMQVFYKRQMKSPQKYSMSSYYCNQRF